MAGRGRNRLPEIRRGQGEPGTGPDRPDLGPRRLRRRVSAQGRSTRRRQRKFRLCRRKLAAARQYRQPAALADLAAAATTASSYPATSTYPSSPSPYSNSAPRQPAYGAAPGGPISLAPPGVAPEEDDIDLPPEGMPGVNQPAAKTDRSGVYMARRPIRRATAHRALFAASRCLGALPASGAVAASRAVTGQSRHAPSGRSPSSRRRRWPVRSSRCSTAGSPMPCSRQRCAGSARASSRSGRSPPIPAAA